MPTSVPNDVVSEILSWAPVKSACRFRCASTGWRALISDPAFVAAHKARTEPQLLIVANSFHGVASGGRRRRRDLRLLDADGGVVREVKSVGDLWTIISGPRGPVCATRVGRVLNVIDLATGDVLLTSTEMDDGGASCTFGIGYAAPWDEGKVVRLTSLYYMGYAARPPEHTCDVLTLEIGAGTWRRRRSPPIIDRVCFHKNSVVTIDGVLYFLYSLAPPQVGYRVLRLDLETEEWKRSIKAPVRLQEVRSEVRMVELDGTLCMVHSEERGTKHACTTIWLLSDLAEGTWVEAYMIPMAPTIDLVIPFRVMHHGGKLMCYCLRNDRPSPTLQVYDPLNGTCTHLADLPDNHVGDVGFCDLHLECYIRST